MCLNAAAMARVWLSCASWARAERSRVSPLISMAVRFRTVVFVSLEGSDFVCRFRGRTIPKWVAESIGIHVSEVVRVKSV